MSKNEAERSESVLQVEGVFDIRAAKRVVEYLGSPGLRGRVHVDLTKVTEFHDFGIGILAQALSQMRPIRVRLAGLRTHQVRMLKYFGFDAGRAAET